MKCKCKQLHFENNFSLGETYWYENINHNDYKWVFTEINIPIFFAPPFLFPVVPGEFKFFFEIEKEEIEWIDITDEYEL